MCIMYICAYIIHIYICYITSCYKKLTSDWSASFFSCEFYECFDSFDDKALYISEHTLLYKLKTTMLLIQLLRFDYRNIYETDNRQYNSTSSHVAAL
jgi:hypothetical protein